MCKAISLVITILLLSFAVPAQVRTVTNADLEEFRERRLKAEKELRENYQRLGFPSPDEMARRDEESRRQRDELSARLARQRAEREAAEHRQEAEAVWTRQVPIYEDGVYYSAPGYYILPRWYFSRFRTPRVVYPDVGNGIPLINTSGRPPTPLRIARPAPLFRRHR
jgi:hypothetical protein